MTCSLTIEDDSKSRRGGNPKRRARRPRTAPARGNRSIRTRPAGPASSARSASAFRPTDLRGDIAALPTLLRHRSFLIPLALIAGATAILAGDGREGADQPLAGSVLPRAAARGARLPRGLPRATGELPDRRPARARLRDRLVVVLSTPADAAAATGATGTAALAPDVLASLARLSAVGGAFFAAAAAWYKRFLALASPAAAARRERQAGRQLATGAAAHAAAPARRR